MGLGKTIEVLSLIHAAKYSTDGQGIAENPKPSTSRSVRRANTSYANENQEKYPSINTTLIVCPMSLLSQWRDEVINVSAEDTMSVEVYYGKQRNWNLKSIRARKAVLPDVLVTTYGVLVSEFNDEEKKPSTSPLFNGKN
jgi:DNA repair protein RAD5